MALTEAALKSVVRLPPSAVSGGQQAKPNRPLTFQPGLHQLALCNLQTKSRNELLSKIPDYIPGYQETAGQVAKSHHRK